MSLSCRQCRRLLRSLHLLCMIISFARSLARLLDCSSNSRSSNHGCYVRLGRWSVVERWVASSSSSHPHYHRLLPIRSINDQTSHITLKTHLDTRNDLASLPVPLSILCSVRTRRRKLKRRRRLHSPRLQPQIDTGDDEATKSSSSLGISREDTHVNVTFKIQTSFAAPLIEKAVWDALRGDEFVNDVEGHLLDAFASQCQQLVTKPTSEWIEWKPFGKHGSLQNGAVNVWIGRVVDRYNNNNKNKNDEYCGSHLPLIKSQSIVPLSPKSLVDLLMDSSRVTSYNKWSIGRTDLWVHPDASRRLSIVKNQANIPMSSKPLVSTTMMHARPILHHSSSSSSDLDGSWMVISRAVGGTHFDDVADDNNNSINSGRSDIFLGINHLQPVQRGDQLFSLVTAITHVQTSLVPTMLAEKFGVKGAVQFVRDLRKLGSSSDMKEKVLSLAS